MLVIVVALNAATVLAIFQLEPYYDASASVLIETSKSAFSDLQAAIGSVTTDTIALRTQADIVQSPAMALKVVDKLDLVHTREFAKALHPNPSLVTRVAQLVSTRLQMPSEAPRVLTDREQRQLVAGLVLQTMTVNNVGRSYIIEIRIRTHDPALSAKIANAYAEFYVAFNKEVKQAAITQGSTLLDARLAPLRDRVHAAETAVETFREQNGIMLAQMGSGTAAQRDGTTIASQQLGQVNASYSEAIANLAQKEGTLNAVDAARRRGNGVYGIPEVIASPLIQRLREQEAQITSRIATQNAVPSASNPLLRSTNAELADVRGQINSEVAKIVDSLRSEVASARARRDSLQGRLSQLQTEVTTQNQAGVVLKQLESDADAARTTYRDFLSRYEQTSNQLALQEPDARLVSTAEAPLLRAGPPRVLYSAIGFFVSLVLAASLAFIKNWRWARAVRTPHQLETETGLTSLGMIPTLRGRAGARSQFRLRAGREALNLLHSMLKSGPKKAAPRVVMVTSALPGEGKTWFATTFAGNAGRIGDRVLLVDCDRHRPSVAKVLGLPGAEDDLSEQNSPFLLRREVLKNVDVMTLRLSNPEGWEGMRGLLRAAREHYELIVLDTPPVLISADAASLASAADGVVMVVRWGVTSVAKVQAALRMLRSVGAPIIGGMLSQVSVEKLSKSEADNAAVDFNDYYRQPI